MSDAVVERLQYALASAPEQSQPMNGPELPSELACLAADSNIVRLQSAAVLLAVINRANGSTLLLTRRAEGLRKHGGQISFPGGARDPDDADAAATALRESQEEVGLDPRQARIIGYLDDYPTVTGYRITPVVALIPDSFNPKVASPDEVAEVFEVPLAVLLDRRNYRQGTYERNGVTVPYFEVSHGPYRIWGATAGILRRLCLRVGGHG